MNMPFIIEPSDTSPTKSSRFNAFDICEKYLYENESPLNEPEEAADLNCILIKYATATTTSSYPAYKGRETEPVIVTYFASTHDDIRIRDHYFASYERLHVRLHNTVSKLKGFYWASGTDLNAQLASCQWHREKHIGKNDEAVGLLARWLAEDSEDEIDEQRKSLAELKTSLDAHRLSSARKLYP